MCGVRLCIRSFVTAKRISRNDTALESGEDTGLEDNAVVEEETTVEEEISENLATEDNEGVI